MQLSVVEDLGATLTNLVTVAVLVFVGVRVGTVARIALARRGRQRTLAILTGLHSGHFLRALPVLALVAATAMVLVQVPGLDFGWWVAIGGVGNPVTGSTSTTAGTSLEWAIPLLFLTVLLPGLPLLAEAEERLFRAGAERRTMAQNLRRAVLFGLVHAIVGIAIGVALALTIGGLYFTSVYLRAQREGGPDHGIMESTRAHLAYNLWVVGLALGAFGYLAFDALTA